MNNPKKILIIRFSAMGDVILTTPVIRYLTEKYPHAEIDYITKEKFTLLLQDNPMIKNVLFINDSISLKEIIFQLKKNNYDLVIDLHSNLRSFIIKHLLGVKYFTYKKNALKRRMLCNFKINLFSEKEHVVRLYLKTIDSNNSFLKLPSLEISSSQKAQEAVEKWIKQANIQNDEKVIGFNPGAIYFTKRWPIQNFILLGILLNEKYKVRILIFGGKEDILAAKEIANSIGENAISLAGDFNLQETYEFLKRVKLLVTGDTGLMHLSSAAKIPVIALFGPTVKEFGFSPYGEKDIVVEKQMSCRPCTLHGSASCHIGTHACLENITSEEVFEFCKRLI